MTQIIINPGTEPVKESSEFLAGYNLCEFMKQARFDDYTITRQPEDDRDGFYTSLITLTENHVCYDDHRKADMSIVLSFPGVPLEQVMFKGLHDQSPWDYKRIYVNHSSWLWSIALQIVIRWQFLGHEEH